MKGKGKASVTKVHPKTMPRKMPMGKAGMEAEQLRKTGQAPFKAVRPYAK